MKSIRAINKQSGAVSLFVVIFAILLMSVVTISFLRIMTADQNQASGNDLARSAYDSALAGVEDAKRTLVWYTQQCKTSPGTCSDWATKLATTECNAAIRLSGVVKTGDISGTSGGTGTGEIKVQQSTAVDESGNSIDKALDQAYTCVTLKLNTDDYKAKVPANQSILVPLISTGSFSSVTIEWFSRDDVTATDGTVKTPSTTGTQPLLNQSDWVVDRPSLLRAQYMQVGSNFKLSDFDYVTDDAQSNGNTIFLYPSTNGSTTAELVSRDIRRNSAGALPPAAAASAPFPTKCATKVSSGGYACKVTLSLPTPIGGGTPSTAYLRLTSFYAAANVRVTLNGSQFKVVQPIVDSTGRANDVFRRVESRIDLYDTGFPYPEAAVDLNNSLCKDFAVTDTQYIAGSCTP